MKLLESIMILNNGSLDIIAEGSIVKLFEGVGEPEYIEGYTDDDIRQEMETKSTKELSKMVQGWIAKAKDLYLKKGMKESTWNAIIDEVLQLIRMLENGDREMIADRSMSLDSSPIQDKVAHRIVKNIYDQVGSKLGSFEIMGSKILNREDVVNMANIIIESIKSSLKVVIK